jgi:hypothetical protein
LLRSIHIQTRRQEDDLIRLRLSLKIRKIG